MEAVPSTRPDSHQAVDDAYDKILHSTGTWHNHEESNDGETMVRHAHEGGEKDHTHDGPGFKARQAREVHPLHGRLGM